jgi:hypothetical protein
MNNLDNYFELVIMGCQICLTKSYISNNIKYIHKKIKNYKWHLVIALTWRDDKCRIDAHECN